MKKKKFLIILIIFYTLPVLLLGKEDDKDVSLSEKSNYILTELAKNFRGLKSFEAQYQALTTSGESAIITLISNKQQKYILIKFAEKNKSEKYIIFDYLDINHSIIFYAGVDESKKFTLKIRDMFENLNNPFGILFFMIKQLNAENGESSKDIKYSDLGPRISLSLTKKNIEMSVGFSSIEKSLHASWLDYEEMADAEDILEYPDYFQFNFKDNHTISIDRETGMLLKDCWVIDPIRKDRREIKLIKQSAITTDVSYTAMIPGFKDIKFIEASPKQFYKQIGDGFLKEVLNSQSDLEVQKLDEYVQNHSDKFKNPVRNTARETIKADPEIASDMESIISFREKLYLLYKNFLETDSEETKNISFNEFLDLIMSEIKSNPSKYVAPELSEWIQSLNRETLENIERMPENKRESFKKFYNICRPAITEGFTIGILEKMIERIKEQQ